MNNEMPEQLSLPRPLIDYKAGEFINGVEIGFIYSSCNDYIIYKSAQGGFHWYTQDYLTENQEFAQFRYKLLENNLFDLNNQELVKRFRWRIEQAFIIGFQCPNQSKEELDKIFKDIESDFQEAKKDDFKTIVSTTDYKIYRSSNGILGMTYRSSVKPSPELFNCLNKARWLDSISCQYLSENEHELYTQRIAHSFSHAFSLFQANETLCQEKIFHSVEQMLNNRIVANLRVIFLSYVTFVCFVFLVLAGILDVFVSGYSIYFYAVYASLSGSFVSVLQRHNSVSLDPLTNSKGLVVDAISRICIGVIFGGFTILLSKSELALANFNDNYMALIVFAFLAGFTERFAPDMLEKVVDKEKNQ